MTQDVAFAGKHVIITPLYSSKITIERAMNDAYEENYSFRLYFKDTLSIEIRNVIFDWKNTAPTCNDDAYCDYCPYVVYDSKDNTPYNDRGDILSDFLSSEWCEYDKNLIFIEIKSSNLLLKNVSFINFRTGFNSLFMIRNDTNVTFYDVTFENIKVSDDYESWVIRWNGNGYGNFKFENGVVSRLNNGYELYDPINTKGFLNATGINAVVFRNVEFRDNVVFKQSVAGLNVASLIYLNLFQALWIETCTFLHNLCDFAIINIQQQSSNFPVEIDDDGIILYSKLNNIYIFNSIFESNYGRIGGVLHALYEYESQNFLIENSSFTLNGVERGSLIHIESDYINNDYLVDSTLSVISPDGNTVIGKYLAKWGRFQNSNFTRNYSGGAGIIETIRMINIKWEKLNIDSNGLLLSEAMNINSIFMKLYIENPLVYAKFNITNPTDLNCKSLSIVSDSVNFNIEASSIEKNYCMHSSPSIIISNALSILKSVYFDDNKGTGSNGICLAFLEDAHSEILDSEFNSNINYQSGSPGGISSLSSVLIQNCSFFNNIGTLLFKGKNLSIFSSNFDSNSSPRSNGGAISVSSSIDSIESSTFFISNATFTNNSCSFSGGAIYIEKVSPLDSPLKLQIYSTNFLNNQALDGSCIYIDNSLGLYSNSSVSDCSFQENIASFSGTILAYYLYGILVFDNCEFVKNKAIYSSGLNIAIGENTDIKNSKIILNSCTFRYNSGHTTVFMDNSNINSTLEVYESLFEYNYGSTFLLDNDYAVVKDSKVQHNFSPSSGGALNLKNSAIFESKSTIYLNCSSSVNGGVASISLNSKFICFSCVFSTNNADSSGGAIYADSDAEFYISDSIINKNSCKNKGSAIFMASSSAGSTIYNTEISENYAYNDGAIFILSSYIYMLSSKIYKNTAYGKNPGLYIDDSSAMISNTSFFDQSGNQGCFIYMSTSYANIINSAFYEGFSNSSGIAIHATSSSIEISSSGFSNLFSNDTGGSIYLYGGNILSIKDSEFLNSSSSIDSYSSSVFIENTLFKNHTNTAIYLSQIEELKISGSKFINGFGINGGAVYCTQCNIILVVESLFNSNLGIDGGAIYVENEADHSEISQITINSSNFQHNSASNGGAIWANNINLQILLSVFNGNKVETLLQYSLQDIEDGIGGAIKIGCKESNSVCHFNISSSTFNNNSASYKGGAISWDDSKPFFYNNYFENNSAQYGPDISSFPTMMIFLNNETRNLQSKTISNNGSIITINNVASGQTNNPLLAFALVDDLYQIITTDTSSQAQIQAITADTVISGSTLTYAKNGIYYFDDYIISAKPGSSTYINIVSSAIDTQKIGTSSEILEMSSNFSIGVNLRLCEMGEATVGLICEICPKHYYNIDASNSKCLECPSNAICYGNFSIVPKSGYWRDNILTDKFWKCPHPPACLGSPSASNLSLTGICDKGYENNMCHSCEYGYSRLYRNECQICPDYATNIFRWIGISLFLVFITIVIFKTTRNSWFEPKHFSSIYIKIFWNYSQIIIIIATYNLNWPQEVTEFFYAQTSLDYISRQLFSFDCFLQLSNSKSNIYYIKILITSITPFAVGLLCLGFWVIIYIIKKKSIKEVKDEFISTSIILLFLIQPSIIDTILNAFSCKEINSGEYWLNVDLGIRCWDHNHLFYTLLVALPTISIWVFIVPLLCLINLIKNKNHLGETWMKKRYGFFCIGYKLKYYYWEFVILFYKVILIGISVFLSNISANIQALTAVLFFALFLHIHYRNEPFNETFFNKAETLSRLVLLITILGGLCFLTSDWGTAITYFLLVLLIFLNSLFIAYILAKFFLQFEIFGLIMMRIWRFFYSRGKKYIVGVDSADESELDQCQSQKDSGKIGNASTISDNTKIGIVFKEDLRNSIELDPFCSMESIYTSK
ncbi:unnamed protein product [Blepharisma stoltei]|uniref:Uncharacterized protein n=1 Tax=Blepharisma stoltei TaxID=1481888 RepID=A0AAU9IH64_9CILI|nr:unnamed protein product [Blepharisma stoltei]